MFEVEINKYVKECNVPSISTNQNVIANYYIAH